MTTPAKVKRGDTHTVTLTVTDDAGAPVDLTGATVRVLALPIAGGSTVTLASSVANPAAGQVVHTLTGLLPVGRYRVEVEVTSAGVITTSPTGDYATLDVVADLG